MMFFFKWLKNPYVIAGLFLIISMGYISFLKSSLTKTKLKLAVMELNFKNCQDANVTNLNNISTIKETNKQLIARWTEAKNNNAEAVILIKHAKRLHDEQINKLKAQVKPLQACDTMFVSNEHIKLLQQASNN